MICVSCENEIKLFPDDMPSQLMIYGILDANSDQQNIKIRKTFGGNSDLNGMTQNPDLFIPSDSLIVKLKEWREDGLVNHYLSPYTLAKESGQFSETGNIIYQGTIPLIMDTRYDLYIENTKTREVVRATTKAIEPPVMRFPTADHTVYRFADTINHFYIKYVPTGSVHLQQFFINYIELLYSGDTLFSTVDFQLTPKFIHPGRPVSTYTRTYSKDYVLNIMRMLIPEKAEVRERQLHSFDFIIWAGDEHLKDYVQLAEKYNDNRRQFFSNISGGLGIFAACAHTSIEGIWPRKEFYDTIANSFRLRNLHFSTERYKGEFKKEEVSQTAFKH